MKLSFLKYAICVIVFFSFFILIHSCAKNHEDELIKIDTLNITCDTVNNTYTKIKSIFNDNCVICHNEQINNRGIKLNNYENARNAAQTGLLKKAVNHLPGVTPMPFELPMLSKCDIRKITIWIETNTPQ